MKLYVCLSYYHTLICLVKALLSGEKFDLYLTNIYIPDYELLKERLEKTGCFSNIYLYDGVNSYAYTKMKNKLDSFLNYRRRLKRAVKKFGIIDFSKYDDVYIFADHTFTGKYLILNKIPYHLIEDALDFFQYFDKFYKVDLRILKRGTLQYFLYNHISLPFVGFLPCWGSSPYAIDIEVNNIEGIKIPTDKVIEVPRKEMFDALNAEQKLLIYNTFVPGKRVDGGQNEKSVLLCTQPLFRDRFVDSKEKQLKVFESAVQMFVNDGYYVVIKPHPRDDIDYMGIVKKYGCGYVDKNLPSEVLNFDPNVSYDLAVSITSTSINFLDFAKEKKFLGREFIEKVLNEKSLK